MQWVIIISLVIGSSFAQVPFLGSCPDLEVVKDFKVEKVSVIENFK